MFVRPQRPADLDRVIEEILPRLYNVADYLTADSHRAEDLVQETLAMFLESFRKDPARIRDPLRWCVRVLARTSWKKKSSPAGGESLDHIVSDQPGPSVTVANQELRERVRDSLQTLPSTERQVISLYVFGEMTVREIARVMAMPRSTVHERLQMGLGRLRRKLASVSGPCLLPPPVAGATELVGWLQAVPAAPVPSSLVQWTASLSITASATGTTMAAQTTGGLLMSVLSTKTVLIGAGAAMVMGLVGLGLKLEEAHRRNRALEARLAATQPDPGMETELAALRGSNQALGRRLVALERERQGAGDTEFGGASRPAAATPLSPESVDRLMAEVVDALNAQDRKRFAAAFLALIDAGDAAHEAFITLLNETGGSYNHVYGLLEGDDPDYPFRRELGHEITKRRKILSGLLDAILSRPGVIDGATLFAFDLMNYNLVRARRPPEEHTSALLDVLTTAIETEKELGERNPCTLLAAEALGRLGTAEILPELEEMLCNGEISESNRAYVARAIAGIGGAGGVGALERFRDSAGQSLRALVLEDLARYGGARLDGFLKESLVLEEDPDVRERLVRAMSKRSRYRDQLIARLDRGDLLERERLTVLESLFESEEEGHRERAWKYYESLDQDSQDEVIGALAGKDARATEILFERLGDSTIPEDVSRGLLRLDSHVVKRHIDTLLVVAGDPGTPLHVRGAAAGALGRVDAQAAVSALLAGFQGLPEPQRRALVRYLADYLHCSEADQALEQIARTDTSASVRREAERAIPVRAR